MKMNTQFLRSLIFTMVPCGLVILTSAYSKASNLCYSSKLDRPVLALTFYSGTLKFVQPVAQFPMTEDQLAYGEKIFVDQTKVADGKGFKSMVVGAKYTSTFSFKFNLDQKVFKIIEKDSDDSSETVDVLSCDVTDKDIAGDPNDIRS